MLQKAFTGELLVYVLFKQKRHFSSAGKLIYLRKQVENYIIFPLKK